MNKASADPKAQLAEQGFAGPFRALGADEAGAALERLLEDPEFLPRPDPMQWRNRHHDTPVLRELATLPSISAVAREAWGQDLVLWRSQLFGLSQFNWHCDRYPDELDPPETLTVHLALTDYDESVGVLFQPGSHRPELPRSAWGPPTVQVLAAGEFLVFHHLVLHASAARFHPRWQQPRPIFTPPSRQRCAVALRIARAGVRQLHRAYAETPERAGGLAI